MPRVLLFNIAQSRSAASWLKLPAGGGSGNGELIKLKRSQLGCN
jgi:hypothetical protein